MRWVGIFHKHSTYISGTSPCRARCLRQSPWLKWLYETRLMTNSKHGHNRAGRIGWTSWIPTMNSAFPNLEGHPGERREMVECSIERLWFLRNRIGHHEPIHTRKMKRDIASMTSLLDWVCLDTSAWATAQRRVQEILLRQPSLK